MPLQRRLPKRGFYNPFRQEFSVVNLQQLEQRFAAGSTVDLAALVDSGLARKGRAVKILAHGELSKALTVQAHAFSEKAKERIAQAGGSAEVLSRA
jgi:large subunit ribosomal protein L15